MNISGIIGPLIGGFLVSISGPGIPFAANALGFLLMFMAILRWKRPRPATKAAAEDFFVTIATAIRYVMYTPGIRVILTRIVLRLTKDEKELLDRLATLRVDTIHPEEFIRVSINKEVIKKNLKS
jgi:MFS family permease